MRRRSRRTRSVKSAPTIRSSFADQGTADIGAARLLSAGSRLYRTPQAGAPSGLAAGRAARGGCGPRTSARPNPTDGASQTTRRNLPQRGRRNRPSAAPTVPRRPAVGIGAGAQLPIPETAKPTCRAPPCRTPTSEDRAPERLRTVGGGFYGGWHDADGATGGGADWASRATRRRSGPGRLRLDVTACWARTPNAARPRHDDGQTAAPMKDRLPDRHVGAEPFDRDPLCVRLWAKYGEARIVFTTAPMISAPSVAAVNPARRSCAPDRPSAPGRGSPH